MQPRKTRPFITERLLMGRKESNQTNKLTVPKLQTACFDHKYFKNYKLLNMDTPNKMLNMVRTISL